MILVASAFGTFMLFVLAGVLALVLTAALDRALGKEIALLLWAGVILLAVLALGPSAAPAPRVRARQGEKEVPVASKRLEFAAAAPLARPFAAPREEPRNPFLKHSDTRPLDPVTIDLPLWVDLDFPLPPTVPGPGPGARRTLRGTLPPLQKGDGSTIPAVPAVAFGEARRTPDEVYDWLVDQGKKTHVYILAVQEGNVWYEEGKPGFEERAWRLQGAREDREGLRVRFALVSNPERKLDPTEVNNAKRVNVSDAGANQFEEWHLRRSVENLWRETLARQGLRADLTGDMNLEALRRAAGEMAEVGRSGKEGGEGWRRAARLLTLALGIARERAAPAVRSEILVDVVDAYTALRDEQQGLQAVVEYARTTPARAEPWLWLGRLHLGPLQLPSEALAYFRAALARDGGNVGARLGEGDALSALGDHRAALAAYEKAGGGPEVAVRRSEAHLRLGSVEAALQAAQDALRALPSDPRAVVARAAALYAKGSLEEAKEAFARAATMESGDALRHRAEALYGLGLACLRLGQADAALAAFDACDEALRMGSSPGRSPEETVSPALGRAVVAFALGSADEVRQQLEQARSEAPRSSYVDAFGGAVASRGGDDATAVRSFERALRLAEAYPELDGWLARTNVRLGRQALDAGAPAEEARANFEAAVAYASRATATEERADPKASAAHLREAWVWIQAEHLTPQRRRFEAALEVVTRVLSKIDREQPAALAIRGYVNYRLADYDQAIRDLDDVLRVVPVEPPGPWTAWRAYAEETQAAIKKWRSLEEKTVEFDDADLPKEWATEQRAGVLARSEPEVGRLIFTGTASKDGSAADPSVVATNKDLFGTDSFERIEIPIWIPTRDKEGNALNNVTFGLQVQKPSRAAGASPAKTAGLGIFYDKGVIAVRAGGGQAEAYRDGEIHRLPDARPWPVPPEGELLRITIVREDRQTGDIAVYLGDDPEPIFKDRIAGFRDSRGPAELWIGGFGNQSQPFRVEIGRIRIVRTRKQ